MAIGIYALYWEDQDLIYIGQSQDIDRRFKEHRCSLKNNKHTNYKVQNAYDKYGLPSMLVLEECKLSEINRLEIEYTAEFNSIASGLNIVEAGVVGHGTLSSRSKYSKATVLKIFSLLIKQKYSRAYISTRCKVPQSLVKSISMGNSHVWLEEQYPDKYMLVSGECRRGKGRIRTYAYDLLDMNTLKVYKVTEGITQLIRENPELGPLIENTIQQISKVLRGKKSNWKHFAAVLCNPS